MTDHVLSAESAESADLADLAVVHSTRLEVLAAATWLQEWPLDEVAAIRMQRALTERVPAAQAALSRLRAQSPLPGAVARGPAGLRSVPRTGEGEGHQGVAPRAGAPLPHRRVRPGLLGGAS